MNRGYARRRWTYGGLLALLVLDGALYFGWLRRAGAEPATDPARLTALEREVAERAVEVARLKRVRELAPQLGRQLDRFAAERFLLERTGFSRVAAELEEAADEAGVHLGRVVYNTRQEKTQPDLLLVEIGSSVEADYANLLRYLEALERSPRFYLISELSVAGASAGGIRLDMQLATYFRRGKA